MKWVKKNAYLVILALLLSSCVKKEILDDINLIEGIGFDLADKGELEGTILFPTYQPDQPPENNTLTAKANIKKEILQDIQLQSPNPTVTGSMEIILFGEELAKKEGVLEVVDAFQRDPGVGAGLYIAVVNGKAKELLEGNYGIRGNATFIANLIENNIENEDLPKTNLQKFLFDYYQEGHSPFMPQLKQLSDEKMVLDGLCFFRYGKVVHHLPPENVFFFRLLTDKFSKGLHRVKIDEGEGAIRDIRSTHIFKLTNRTPYEISIHLKIMGIINEFTGNQLNPNMIKKLEKAFEEEINEKSRKLVETFKENEIDPIGLGHFVKTQTRNFDFDKWNSSEYEKLTVKIKADVTITQAGVIE